MDLARLVPGATGRHVVNTTRPVMWGCRGQAAIASLASSVRLSVSQQSSNILRLRGGVSNLLRSQRRRGRAYEAREEAESKDLGDLHLYVDLVFSGPLSQSNWLIFKDCLYIRNKTKNVISPLTETCQSSSWYSTDVLHIYYTDMLLICYWSSTVLRKEQTDK